MSLDGVVEKILANASLDQLLGEKTIKEMDQVKIGEIDTYAIDNNEEYGNHKEKGEADRTLL